MQNELAIKKFKTFLDDRKLIVSQTKNGAFYGLMQYKARGPRKILSFYVTFESGCICNTAGLSLIDRQKDIKAVADKVLAVNKDLLWGGFDLDACEKRLMYKIVFPYASMPDSLELNEIFDGLLYTPCAMARIYLDTILASVRK